MRQKNAFSSIPFSPPLFLTCPSLPNCLPCLSKQNTEHSSGAQPSSQSFPLALLLPATSSIHPSLSLSILLSLPPPVWLLIGVLSVCGSSVLWIIEHRGWSEYSTGRICLWEIWRQASRHCGSCLAVTLHLPCIHHLTGDRSDASKYITRSSQIPKHLHV